MAIFRIPNMKMNIFFFIIVCKITSIFPINIINNKNTLILEVKNVLIDEAIFNKEKKEKNFYNLIVNKLVPNNLYLDFKINSENVQIPGYLTFATEYNYYGTDICLKLEKDNIFNISSNIQQLSNFQTFNNEYQKYYYVDENISFADINNHLIKCNNIRVIFPQINENKAKCLILGLSPIIDLNQNKGIENLPLAIKSIKKKNNNNNFQTYLTILYQNNTVFMTIGEPPHIVYPDLYSIKNYKEIANYNLNNELSTFFLKNKNIWTIKLDQIIIGNDTYKNGEKFLGQFSLDYIPFILPMDIFRKYLSHSLDYYISKKICFQKGRPLTSQFAHSIINNKKQTFIFIYCEKDKIENLTEFYSQMPDISFRNKELNKTFTFEGKNLFVEEDNFLVLMIMPDLFNTIIITLGKMFMEKYLFCFNYDMNTIGYYDGIMRKSKVVKNITENKFPVEYYYVLIPIIFLVIIIFMFGFFRSKNKKGNVIMENKDNKDDSIEKELIDINKEN